jgi:dolichol kinase
MGNKLKKEIARKMFHLLEIPLVLGYSLIRFVWSGQVAIVVLTALLLILLEVEYIRLEMRPKIPQILNLFRHREQNNVTGTVFFIIATIICFAVYDYSIALLALFLTVFGDLFSALIGIKWGKHKIFRSKTLEGFFAGLVVNLFVGYLLFAEFPLIFIPMAFVASFVELSTNKLDDNLTVPLFAGFTGQMIVYVAGIHLMSFPWPISWLFLPF